MSLKYSNTTADYLQWSEAMNLIRKLAKDGNYKISLLIAIGCFTGLRISDILALRWKQILDAAEFTITERKTGKQRTIRLNKELQEHIKELLQAYPASGNCSSYPCQSERYSFHSTTHQRNTERTQTQIQVEDKAF